jgi:hypothetical protein
MRRIAVSGSNLGEFLINVCDVAQTPSCGCGQDTSLDRIRVQMNSSVKADRCCCRGPRRSADSGRRKAAGGTRLLRRGDDEFAGEDRVAIKRGHIDAGADTAQVQARCAACDCARLRPTSGT